MHATLDPKMPSQTNKRNNSSDERKQESGSPKEKRINSITAKKETLGTTNKEDAQSTGGQTLSLFNEKRQQSLMMSHKENGYGDEYEESGDDF